MAETEAELDTPRVAPLDLLSPFERLAFRVLRWLNGRGYPLARFWQIFGHFPFVSLFIGRRVVVSGAERLQQLPPGASFLLVSNHRTFFDLFTLAWVLIGKRGLRHHVNFPVRANFFYENPLGLLFCLFFSGGSMFPPIFRQPKKRAFNAYGVQLLVEQLKEPRSMIGFHPEGTRGKGPDPYQLLPAQPGAGKLVLEARPWVVPAFVTGLTNGMASELFANLRGKRPIHAVFGEPIDPAHWPQGSRAALQKQVADELLDRIRALQPEERAARGRA